MPDLEIPQPLVLDQEVAQDPYMGRVQRFVARVAIASAVGVGLAGDTGNHHLDALYDNPFHATAVTLQIPEADATANTEIHFGDIRDDQGVKADFSQVSTKHITPNVFLQKLVTTEDPDQIGFGLAPPNIANRTKFKEWVDSKTQNPEIQAQAGITDMNTATPKDLIKLSTAIVDADTRYYYGDDKFDDQLAAMDKIYATPMDETLEKGGQLECEGFSSATEAVFNTLKTEYPQLTNTYMVSASAPAAGHMWNLAVQVEEPDKATAVFVDSTTASTSYKEGPGTNLGAIQFMGDLGDKKLVPNTVLTDEINDYTKQVGGAANLTSWDTTELDARNFALQVAAEPGAQTNQP